MSLKTLPTFVALAALATACGAKEEDDTAVEEPASEPTSEPSTEDTTSTYEIDPDSVLFSFMNGYVGNDISPVMFAGASEAFSGSFTLILLAAARSFLISVFFWLSTFSGL